jgi:hypothetical protein
MKHKNWISAKKLSKTANNIPSNFILFPFSMYQFVMHDKTSEQKFSFNLSSVLFFVEILSLESSMWKF